MTDALIVEAEPAFRTAAANPYNAALASALIEEGATVRDLSYWRLATRPVDIVHLHWPDLTFLSGHRLSIMRARLLLFGTALRLARLRGTRMVWTVHNLDAHEERATPALRARLRRMLARELDGILALSQTSLGAAREAYPELAELPGFVTPHGHYRDQYDLTATRSEARARLDVDPAVTLLAAVGQVRPYKNIPRLLEAFRAVEGDHLRLAVVGRVSPPDLAEEITRLAAEDPRVIVRPTFQPDDAIADWLRAADLVVLPYRKVLNSGSALLALSADRPVLVPALGSLDELRGQVGDEWVRTFADQISSDILRDALGWVDTPRAERVDLAAFDWHTVAHTTYDAYREVRRRQRTTRTARTTRTTSSATGSPIVPVAAAPHPDGTASRPPTVRHYPQESR